MVIEAVQSKAGVLHRLASAYLRRRYTALFYLLLITIVAVPISALLKLTGHVIEFFLAAALLAAVEPVSAVKTRRALLSIAVLLWLARPITAWLDHPTLSEITLGLWTFVGLCAAAGALRFALTATRVTAEHLYAALSAYLLAGVFFGSFYSALEQVLPGSFNFSGEFSRMSALYFSFVTLATLGYGDIVPRTDIARCLAIIEGVGGQLFLAVMVARLVSLYVRSDPESRS